MDYKLRYFIRITKYVGINGISKTEGEKSVLLINEWILSKEHLWTIYT